MCNISCHVAIKLYDTSRFRRNVNRHMRSFEILHGVQWQFPTDASGQPISLSVQTSSLKSPKLLHCSRSDIQVVPKGWCGITILRYLKSRQGADIMGRNSLKRWEKGPEKACNRFCFLLATIFLLVLIIRKLIDSQYVFKNVNIFVHIYL
jgi:hypothetical protein